MSEWRYTRNRRIVKTEYRATEVHGKQKKTRKNEYRGTEKQKKTRKNE